MSSISYFFFEFWIQLARVMLLVEFLYTFVNFLFSWRWLVITYRKWYNAAIKAYFNAANKAPFYSLERKILEAESVIERIVV